MGNVDWTEIDMDGNMKENETDRKICWCVCVFVSDPLTQREREREQGFVSYWRCFACHRMISDKDVLFCCINFHRKY